MNRPLRDRDAVRLLLELQTAQAEFDQARATVPDVLLNSQPLCSALAIDFYSICGTTGKTALQQTIERPYIAQEIRRIRSTVLDMARKQRLPFITSKVVRDAHMGC